MPNFPSIYLELQDIRKKITDLTNKGIQLVGPAGGILVGSYPNPSGLTGDVGLNGTLNIGPNNVIIGSFTLANGNAVAASGNYSHAEGEATIASGLAAHAEGNSTVASDRAAHSEGYATTANNQYSHAEGYATLASGEASHAEGLMTIARGQRSHSEGYNTTASSDSSHAEGHQTHAQGATAHAEGYQTLASGDASHAEGGSTTASNFYSHAEGVNTLAQGNSSHAEGRNTHALWDYSHTEGYQTTSSAYYQHVQGTWNATSSNALMIVGNGTDASNRKNILEVHTDKMILSGNIHFKNGLGINFSQTPTAPSGTIFLNSTLSDYEEGTWTPQICEASTGNSIWNTYDWNVGTYIKIGKLVYINANIKGKTRGDSAPFAIGISHLPYLSKNTTSVDFFSGMVSSYTYFDLSGNTMLCSLSYNSTILELRHGYGEPVLTTHIQSPEAQINLSMIYIAD